MSKATLMPCHCGPDRALVSCRSRSLPLISCAKLWNKLIQFFGDCPDDPGVSNPDFLLGAARPLPPSADIGPGGQSVGQAVQFCLEMWLMSNLDALVFIAAVTLMTTAAFLAG